MGSEQNITYFFLLNKNQSIFNSFFKKIVRIAQPEINNNKIGKLSGKNNEKLVVKLLDTTNPIKNISVIFLVPEINFVVNKPKIVQKPKTKKLDKKRANMDL